MRAPRVTGRDVVQARRGIEHHVARRQLHALHAVGVFDAQFAAVVFLGPARKSVAERSVRMRCGVPVTCRIALSTCVPNDCPPGSD